MAKIDHSVLRFGQRAPCEGSGSAQTPMTHVIFFLLFMTASLGVAIPSRDGRLGVIRSGGDEVTRAFESDGVVEGSFGELVEEGVE